MGRNGKCQFTPASRPAEALPQAAGSWHWPGLPATDYLLGSGKHDTQKAGPTEPLPSTMPPSAG